jgi:hypothetical protein
LWTCPISCTICLYTKWTMQCLWSCVAGEYNCYGGFFLMNELLAYDRNGTSMCDSYMVGWHKPLKYNFYLSTASQKQLQLIVLLENVWNTRPTGTCEICSCSEFEPIFTNVRKPKLRHKSRRCIGLRDCEIAFSSSANTLEISLPFRVLCT